MAEQFSMAVSSPSQIMEEVKVMTEPQDEESKQLRQQAEANAQAIMELDLDSLQEKTSMVKDIESFGISTMTKSANKNSLLKVTVDKLSKSGADDGLVSRSLMDLHHEIKDLDPSALDFTKQGILGKIFNPVRGYFEKYEKADAVIADIVKSLDQGKQTLVDDNTTLSLEAAELRGLTIQLNKEIKMGAEMDSALEAKLQEAEANGMDPDKVRFVQEEILYPLRQRIMDMQQMITVNQQGIIAMEVVQRNNKELIRGVQRAKTVTVSALRTGVMVASALYNQKIVLTKIQALNETTENIVAGTSRMLKEQGTEIHQMAASANMSPETMKTAFMDVLTSLEEISNYKQQALPMMKDTIQQFRELADTGEAEIRKLEQGNKLNA